MVGFLGAFTTFSAFAVEVLQTLRQAGVGAALVQLLLHNTLAICACCAGYWLLRASST